jgi:general secretion pathway protein N
MNLRVEKNLTLVLAGACGVLLLLVMALEFGVGRGYSWNPDPADAQGAEPGDNIDHTPFKLSSPESYAEINTRPLFNDDRKATPPGPPEDGTVPAAPPPPLKIRLSGVMITRKARVAMISDDRKNPPAMVKEGMPLPGDLGGWTLAKLNPRSAVFKNAGGENIQLELEPGAQGQKPATPTPGPQTPGANQPQQQQPGGAAPVPVAPPQAAAGFGPAPGAPGANGQSEELQHRIDERRKQIREQNDRLRQQAPQQSPQQQTPQQSPQQQTPQQQQQQQ